MTQEKREFLFKDLSARLPYHVKVKVWLKDGTTEEGILDFEHTYNDVLRDAFYLDEIEDIKPYLRPMSSMTKEEEEELIRLFGMNHAIEPGADSISWYHVPSIGIESVEFLFRDTYKLLDWLNAHHFDYRGLIKMGLALEAPEGMYD